MGNVLHDLVTELETVAADIRRQTATRLEALDAVVGKLRVHADTVAEQLLTAVVGEPVSVSVGQTANAPAEVPAPTLATAPLTAAADPTATATVTAVTTPAETEAPEPIPAAPEAPVAAAPIVEA